MFSESTHRLYIHNVSQRSNCSKLTHSKLTGKVGLTIDNTNFTKMSPTILCRYLYTQTLRSTYRRCKRI